MRTLMPLVLISLIIVRINCEQCFTKFRMKPTCVVPYGNSSADIWRRSHVECAMRCLESPPCQSFFYFKTWQICRQNSAILTNFTLNCAEQQLYAEKMQNTACSSNQHPASPTAPQTTFPPPFSTTFPAFPTTTSPQSGLPGEWLYMYYPYFFMSDPCITNVECEHLLGSECRDGVCQCLSGYSFDWTAHKCVNFCEIYGHSYQIEYDTVLVGYDNNEFPNMSEEQCLQKCTDTTMYTCKSAEYDVITMTCYLSNETTITQPTAWNPVTLTNLYHRDCLFV